MLFLLVFSILWIHNGRGYNLTRSDLQSLQALFPPDYDKSLPPYLDTKPSKPLSVGINLKVREVQNVDEQNMEITVEWFVRLYWLDGRIIPPSNKTHPDGVNCDPRIIDYIWIPSAFIDHVIDIKSPTLLVAPLLLIVYPDGNMWFSISKVIRLSCPMDFSAYPFDKQSCFMRIEDYRLSHGYIHYMWSKPIEIGEMSKHPQFSFSFENWEHHGSSHAGDVYSGVSIKISLTRSIVNHLMNTYFPSTLLVMVSWLSFLVPTDQVPGRMVLTITTLLALMSMFSAVRKEGPQVSYAKAIDQWMLMCLFFVFLALIEFAMVLYLRHKGHMTLKNRIRQFKVTDVNTPQLKDETIADQNSRKYIHRAELLEHWSWIFLVISFAVFIFTYWGYWFIMQEGQRKP